MAEEEYRGLDDDGYITKLVEDLESDTPITSE